MNVCSIHLVKPIWWKICRNDPDVITLSYPTQTKFLNPLLESATPFRHRSDSTVYPYTFVDKDTVCFASDKLLFLSDEPFASEFVSEGIYEQFLKNLRLISRQARFPNNAYAMEQLPIAAIPDLSFPLPSPTITGVMIATDILRTTVTWNHVKQVAATTEEYVHPVYDVLLLDAIAAYHERQYTTAILYCVIAVETLAGVKLSAAYEMARQSHSAATSLRMVQITQAGGRIQTKDPVYECLQEKDDFSQLLHARSLYLLNKSLLIENEQLYQRALTMYRTRNQIVHRGGPPQDRSGKYIELNQNGALQAIETAIQVSNWFGEGKNFTVPKFGFTDLGV